MKKLIALLLNLFILISCNACSSTGSETLCADISTLYRFPPDYKICGINALGDSMAVCANGSNSSNIILFKHENGNFSEPVAVLSQNEYRILGFTSSDTSYVALLGKVSDKSGEKYESGFLKFISPDGDILNTVTTEPFLNTASGIICINEKIIVWDIDTLYIYDENGTLLSATNCDHDEFFSVQSTDSTLVLQLSDGVYIMDTDNGDMSEFNGTDGPLSSNITDYLGKVLYDDSILKELDLNSGDIKELFNWSSLAGNNEKYEYLCRLNDKMYVYSKPESSTLYFMLLRE